VPTETEIGVCGPGPGELRAMESTKQSSYI
jgi:hypothetical protein